MTVKWCPSCAEIMVQQPYIINGESIMFWVCPEGDWEEPVNSAPNSTTEEPEAES
jgi:hypothetical protein